MRIQVDLVGEIDFTRRRAFVLARLVDSKLTRFDLKGAAAIFVDWGEQPTFIMSFGGFNPRYHLPQGVPPELASLERLSVSLAREKHLELTFTAYLAFTPNTFQVGGRIHAFASAGKFSIDGSVSVDALIDRHEAPSSSISRPACSSRPGASTSSWSPSRARSADHGRCG
ncbi:MAG: DUF6603 domain-containing protein [Vicinamibacterales bacterium]